MERSQLPGVYTDGGEANPAFDQPAGVLATWIDEQLRDIRSNQVARLAQLRVRLQTDAFEWDNAALTRAVEVMREQANELNLDALRRRGVLSLLRRPPPRGRFAAQYGRVVAAAASVRKHAEDLAENFIAHTSGARRVLLELEMEQQSLAADLAQAIGWLEAMSQDMHRRGSDPAQAERMALLARRAGVYTTQLKRLHVLQDMAAGVCAIGRNVIERRAALIEQLRADLDGFQKVWQRRVGNLAGAAPRAPTSAALDAAFGAQGELLSRLEDTCAACEALQLEEHQVGLRLAAMRTELDALNASGSESRRH